MSEAEELAAGKERSWRAMAAIDEAYATGTHLLTEVVAPDGRLIVGVFNEETDQDALEREVACYGLFTVIGRTTAPHRHPALSYKAFWLSGVAGDGLPR